MSPVSEISPYLCLDLFICQGRLTRFPRSRFFPTGISGRGRGILPYDSSALLPGWKQDEFWPRWRRLVFACCIFRIISIAINCSDSALRVAKAMIGTKVIIFVFRMSAFLSLCAGTRPQDHWPSVHLGNRAEISPSTQGEIGLGNEAYMKRP